jgi:hypothetical protein
VDEIEQQVIVIERCGETGKITITAKRLELLARIFK